MEVDVLRQAKEKSEANVAELKGKLREEVHKSQQLVERGEPKQAQAEVNKTKYDELITAVLALELATDPLAEMNLSLQQSFIDEAEQATSHLDEQARLVKNKLQAQEGDMKALLQRYESLKQEKDQIVATAQKDSQKAQEIKLELETQIQECERQRQLIDLLEQSKRASPRGLSDTESLKVLDALIGKHDAS